ncbi:MAG: glutamate-5-semialdehyde dehydrogenase [Candidatus Actinomarina sp.]|nr:glutamate-5-semialdehyde dehydrogenase [Candidatus Actinomarina sp.]MBL6836692.1 glutamate-5-semialdehyde dehydrogenase [Candidatus Actinomarina sp.]
MLKDIGIKAQKASQDLKNLDSELKNQIIHDMSQQLLHDKEEILEANSSDIKNANNLELSSALLDRLTLSEERLKAMSLGLQKIISLPDPVNSISSSWKTKEGLNINKIRSPFGVIGVIYEARPNVTSDVSALCIKSGNAVILKGSSYCLDSNSQILNSLQAALKSNDVDINSVQLIKSKNREDAIKFMQMKEYIDLIVPRGGRGLIDTLVENAKVPFILDGDGNVHLYIHEDAKREYINNIVINAKVQRPGVCNALETLLIHRKIYEEVGHEIISTLIENQVQLFVDKDILKDFPSLQEVTQEHFETEFHDLKLAIGIVDTLEEAINHVQKYSSGHTEGILTESTDVSSKFSSSIDSSVIFINTSTRFTDGEMFGFGAEVGISTQKLHVRGPMGLEALTTERYVIETEGVIRE